MKKPLIQTEQIDEAALKLKQIISATPLQYSKRLSQKYNADVYIKREDLQEVRSFKIRGAYNKISSLTPIERKKGIVCASAGNHAQGVALSCAELKIKGAIFMPQITPNQKIEKVKHFGDGYVTVHLIGTTFDDAYAASVAYAEKHQAIYVHPFDDKDVIAGQGTVGKEIYETLGGKVDVVLAAIGGGGLISGTGSYLKGKNPYVSVVGCEPQGAPSMKAAMKQGEVVKLEKIDPFVDGAAVMKVGSLTYKVCKTLLDDIVVIPEGKVCTTMIELYQYDGIIAEPAGALSIAALDTLGSSLKGKTVVCVLSGGNNDILRYPDVMERSLVYLGRKHYFVIQFPQKPGELRSFLNDALGPHDDIVLFEYMKKTNREKGPALVGIELQNKEDLKPLLKKMDAMDLKYQKIESESIMYNLLI